MMQTQPIQPTFDHAGGNDTNGLFLEQRVARGLYHSVSEDWPYVGDPLDVKAGGLTVIHSERGHGHSRCSVLYDAGDGLAVAHSNHGNVSVTTTASTPGEAAVLMKVLRRALPEHEQVDPGIIPVTFWAYGPNGSMQFNRDLSAMSWPEIRGNYAASTLADLETLMDPEFRPGTGGQLVLWHGDPGSGKTTALRALACAWREWAELHYITDPDQFFGQHADYMLQVMLAGGDNPPISDDEPVRESKWRVLVLEDSGELLLKDAKRETGQALSRFLNSVDGLIGQGLRVLTLVTTNEDRHEWHPAVTRYGRAMSHIEFLSLNVSEANAWLSDNAPDVDPVSAATLLADLYGLAAEGRSRNAKQPVGFVSG